MSILIAEAVKGIPHQVKQNSRIDAGVVSRTTRHLGPPPGEYSFSTNPVIEIPMPARGHYDMQYSALQFRAQWDLGAELLRGVASLFRRVAIVGPNGEITGTDNIDVLNSMVLDCTMNNYQQNTAFAILAGTGSTSRRQTIGGHGGTFFSIQPLLDLLRYERFLSMHLIGPCRVVLELQDPRVCFKHNAEVAVKITNVNYRVDLVQFNAEVEAKLLNAWANDQIRYHFKEWRHTTKSSAEQQAVINVTNQDYSVDAIMVAIRKTSVTVDQAADSYERFFGDLEEIAVDAGSNKYERVNCRNGGAGPFFELQRALDFSENIGFTPEEWVSTKFIFGFNLAILNGNPDAVAGFTGKSDIKLEFYRSSPPPEMLRYDIFVLHDKQIQCGQNEGTRTL